MSGHLRGHQTLWFCLTLSYMTQVPPPPPPVALPCCHSAQLMAAAGPGAPGSVLREIKASGERGFTFCRFPSSHHLALSLPICRSLTHTDTHTLISFCLLLLASFVSLHLLCTPSPPENNVGYILLESGISDHLIQKGKPDLQLSDFKYHHNHSLRNVSLVGSSWLQEEKSEHLALNTFP